jgi:hypothetical protein
MSDRKTATLFETSRSLKNGGTRTEFNVRLLRTSDLDLRLRAHILVLPRVLYRHEETDLQQYTL